MTKLIKMSLVAAVAVAGLSSTAAAKPLEEAIKNVDVSGMIRLRFDSEQANDGQTTTDTDFDTDITFKSKISDKTSATIKIEADKGHDSNSVDTRTKSKESSRLNAEVSVAALTTKFDMATVSVGRVGLPGPFDDAQGGDGILATVPMGSLTAVAGFFTTTSLKDTASTVTTNVVTGFEGKDAYELALMGQAGPVALDVWYAKVANAISLTSFHAAANIEGISIDARHTVGTLDKSVQAADRDASLTKVFASTDIGMVSLSAGFALTDEENGGNANRVSLDNAGAAGSDVEGEQIQISALSDATAFIIGAGVTVDQVELGATYITADYDGATKEETADEYILEAKYNLDTNLAIKGVYSMYDTGVTGGNDQEFTRIELKYTF